MLLANVGVVLAATGISTRPSGRSRRVWRAARRLGNLRSVGNWLRALGSISLARRDYARARLRFEESLAVGRTLGDRWEIAHSLSNLALVALEARRRRRTRAMLAESAAIEREAGDRLGLAGNLEMCARFASTRSPGARLPPRGVRGRTPRVRGHRPVRIGWPDPESDVGRAPALLGEEPFAEAWQQGCAMTLDESLDYALEGDRRALLTPE